MDYNNKYSLLASKMKSSKIRELMKYANMPGIISFGGGNPDPVNFPFPDVKNIINNWDNKKIISAMQYGPTPGFPSLIEKIKHRLKDKKFINVDNQDLVITAGGEQGIYLVTKVLVSPGDVVIIEEPSFIGAMASFLANGAELVSVPLQNDGVDLDMLEKTIIDNKNKGKNVKFFYTIPTFQNPAGISSSIEKRKKLYDISKKHELIILEDDPYSDLFFTGDYKDYKPIKSFGNDAPIIYVSSFSKILCPGFRLGWVFGDKEIIDKVQLAKQAIDACSSSFGQMVADDYLSSDAIDRYLTTMRSVYKNKKELMIKCINENFPEKVITTNPSGGFFIYIDFPEGFSADKLFKKTIEKKVAFVTGDPFHIDPAAGDKHARLAFSNSTNEEIQTGIKILGDTIKEMI